MTTVKTVAANYTAEMVTTIVASYKAGEPLETIAKNTGKSVASIRAKLSSLKVYISKAKSDVKTEKIGGSKVNKDGLKAYLESLVGKELLNVEAASKDALLALINAIKARDDKIQSLIDDMLGDESESESESESDSSEV